MRYYQKVAQPGENLVFRTTIHWVVYLRPFLFLVLALAALGGALWLRKNSGSPAPDPGGHSTVDVACYAAAVVLGLVALIDFFAAFLRRLTTEIAVTDRRVLFKRGLLSRHTVEMNVSKIETVDVEQTLWGRLFNYGNVVIRGTGGTFEPLRGIEHPLQLRNAIMVG